MKKLIAILTLMILLCTSAIPTFAAELTQDNPTGTATVYYKIGDVTDDKGNNDPTDDEIAGTYKITIPDYIEAASSENTPVTKDVTAAEVLIPYNTTLKIYVEYEGKLKLKDNQSVSIGYDLQANSVKVNTGNTILSVPAGTPTAVTTTPIGAKLTESPVYSGVYSNTVTFTVTID